MASSREPGVEHLPEHIGRYQILGLLGTGGMAEILLARLHGPSGFERPVVIKRILPHLAREQRFHDMFLDEARIVAGIRHQNVVHVHELGQEGDQLYLVMEYLEGESASSVARRLAANRKLLNFGLCAHLMAEVAAGLHSAHELKDLDGSSKGLVHRDVSPANVFVTYAGGVKMIDFGIAVAADRISRTDAGQVKGKYAYMSPEQCVGIQLDRRSDIFSMGTVLYELSTCRRLFKRQSDMLTLQAICHEEVLPPRELIPEYPPALERICLKALSKRREDRFETALDMRRELLDVARSLNGSKVPEESLAKVMRRLFPDRIEEKRQMLSKLRAGVAVEAVPAEIDDSVELEPAQDGALDAVSMLHSVSLSAKSPLRPTSSLGNTGTGTGPETTDEPSISVVLPSPLGSPRRWALIFGSLAAAALALVGSMTLYGPSRRPSRSEDAAVSEAAVTERIRLTVTTQPPGAAVVLAGVPRGKTPLDLDLERSSEPLSLKVSMDSHEAVEERFVPDRNQTFRFIMAAAAKQPATQLEPKPAREPKEAVASSQPLSSDEAKSESPKAKAKSQRRAAKKVRGPKAPRKKPDEATQNPYSRFN